MITLERILSYSLKAFHRHDGLHFELPPHHLGNGMNGPVLHPIIKMLLLVCYPLTDQVKVLQIIVLKR